MLLHIGNEVALRKEDVIAVLDYRTEKAQDTKSFLSYLKSINRVVNLCAPGKERSIVITSKKVYITTISTSTLKRRGSIPISME